MKELSNKYLNSLFDRHKSLESIRQDIVNAIEIMVESVKNKGTIFVCGNGGSAADAEHIVGELMKSFVKKRPISEKFAIDFNSLFPDKIEYFKNHLEGSIPAISLVSSVSLSTAFANDVCADMVFAQQVYGLAKENDVVWGISTSGNSVNVNNALRVAKALNCKTIALSGKNGGEMATIPNLLDVEMRIASDFTPDIQELHLPIYHCICAVLEEELFN